MFQAKKVLGRDSCIAGNVTASQLSLATPQTVKEYCRRLIENCGKGGGYILNLGSSVDKTNPANMRAIIETVKEYGVYYK